MTGDDIVDRTVKASRKARRKAYVEALREGRRERAHTFTPKRGKGSYRRRPKHRGGGDE